MKNKCFLKNAGLLLLPLALAGGVLLGVAKSAPKEVEGYSTSSLPTTIDLNDSSASDIRSYYSSLNSLSTSERQGTNLLKNLKTILKNGQKYYSYDSTSAIWQIYEIADRDWDKSPASSTTYGTYNSSTNKITNYTYGTSASNSKNNPYIHALYINRNIENLTTAWDDHQQTEWGINREHVWPKAEGFEEEGAGGARGDPMHLMAGNGYSNNIHSNYYYGYVNTSSSYTNCGTKYSNQTGNLRGKSKTLGGSTNVFEPQDCDKGDIARAIFYMVARYNYLSGSDSDGIDSNNPNLELTQSLSDWESSGYSSTISKTGKMGVMTDLLAWHHADPVDSYEIHRNNLLFKNYTSNRNPFIDFPEWVDFIWGTATYNGSTYQSYSSTPTGYATPSSDTINGYNSGTTPTISVTGVSLNKNSVSLNVGQTEILTATVTPNDATNKNVTWTSSNTNVATVSGGVVTATGAGNATITARTSDGGYTATCSVSVTSDTVSVSSVTLDKNSKTLDIGGSATLVATVSPSNATNKDVTWSSSDESVVIVDDGLITGLKEGSATITVTSDADSSKTDTCNVSVSSGDISLTYSHSPFNGTSFNSSVATKTLDGYTYQYLQAQNYTSNSTLEFGKNTNAYLGNTTGYSQSIRKIVLRWYGNYNNSDLLSVHQGSSQLPSTNSSIVTPTDNGTLSTYDFTGDTNNYFRIKVIKNTYFTQFNSIEIYFNELQSSKTLSSISIQNPPTKTTYNEGENFDPTGLILTLTYSDSSTENVSYASDSGNFSFSPALSDSLTTSNTSVTISYGGKSTTQSITVNSTSQIDEPVLTPGAYASACTVNGKSGVKVGTSGNAGDMTITVPSGADALSFYAASWKGSSDLTLSISGASVSPSSISISPDAGVSSNSPFTLSGDESNYHFVVTLSGIASDTTLTITGSSAIRFVLWGAACHQTYSLVTNVADLRTGDKVLFVGIRNSNYYAATSLSEGLLLTEAVTFTNNQIIKNNAVEYSINFSNSLLSFVDTNENKYLSNNGSSGSSVVYSETATNKSKFSISISNTGAITTQAQQGSYLYFRFNYNSGNNPRFCFSTSATYLSGGDVYIYKRTSQVSADSWAQSFLSGTQNCSLSNWSTLASSYDSLSSSAKAEIISVEANASTDYSLRAQAMARYDYMMSDPRFNTVSHFITERAVASPSNPTLVLINEQTRKPIVIIVCSLISISAIAGFFFVKRRKQEEN